MAQFPPNRLLSLIEKLEKGDTVTQKDVDRVASLQALDLAVYGQEFAEESIQRDREATELLRKEYGGQ